MDLLKEFLEYKLESKDIKKETVEMYQWDMEDFEKFVNKDLFIVSKDDIVNYIKFLKDKYQPNSIMRKLSTIKGFYRFLLKKNMIELLPTEGIFLEKASEKIGEELETWEIESILNSCEKTEKGERDKLLIKLLIETKFSINDVLKLRISDLELNSYLNVLDLDGFGVIKLSDTLSEELKSYVLNLKEKKTDIHSDLLFYGVSRQAFRARFINLGKKAQIKRQVSPNMLRNTLKNVVKLEHDREGSVSNLKIREKYFQIGIGDE